MKKISFCSSAAALLAVLVILTGTSVASERVIPYPKGYETNAEGASSYRGLSDVKNSPYFKTPDYFTMKSNGSLIMISGYRTYQQSTETTCGPCAALTVLDHYKVKLFEELQLSSLMGTLNEADINGEKGTSTEKLVEFFKGIDWTVQSSLTAADKDGYSFTTMGKFKDFVLKNLREGTPIMVENMYWGGHWRVIIGYDTMGTVQTADDVIIFSDSYDVCDHNQDGYMVESAEGFYYTWMDIGLLPSGQQIQQWLIAKPKKSAK